MIWEFRALFKGLQYRLLPAFWDKTDAGNTVVISTNALVKKHSNMTIETMMRVFSTLKAKVSRHVELRHLDIRIG